MKKTILILLLAFCSITSHAQGGWADYLRRTGDPLYFEGELVKAKKGDAKAMLSF